MNQYQLANKAKKRDKVYNLYQTGLTMAQIALLVGQSAGWVHGVIHDAIALEDLSPSNDLNKNE